VLEVVRSHEARGKNHRRRPRAGRDSREHQGCDEVLTAQLRDDGDRSPRVNSMRAMRSRMTLLLQSSWVDTDAC
jgi:hypothetical protein